MSAGKYDDLATIARETSEASAVVLIVIEGKHGSGFSVQTDGSTMLKLPHLLRYMANEIERAGGNA
jgi:hypothetical protein